MFNCDKPEASLILTPVKSSPVVPSARLKAGSNDSKEPSKPRSTETNLAIISDWMFSDL